MVQKRVLLLALCMSTHMHTVCDEKPATLQESLDQNVKKKRDWKIKNCFLAQAVKDIVYLNRYVFDWDTIKIISSIFPGYILLRMFDEDIQNSFYHGHCQNECHKDVHQVPKWCVKMAQYSIALPIVVMFGSLFVGNHELRTTSWIFLLGMPFVIFGKDVFKTIRFDAAKRPWREKFCSKERAYGGFPSGHMAESTYMTLLYGWRYGVRAAGPLAVATTFLGITFINCNRHYPSQIVAGAGIGAIFALAANKVIESKLAQEHNIDLGIDVDTKGATAVRIGWSF